jgi:hypothetical protein
VRVRIDRRYPSTRQRQLLASYSHQEGFRSPANGVRGVLIYCADYRCSHSIAISGDRWADDVRLSDIEARFVCRACGKRGADVRPDLSWKGSWPARWAVADRPSQLST